MNLPDPYGSWSWTARLRPWASFLNRPRPWFIAIKSDPTDHTIIIQNIRWSNQKVEMGVTNKTDRTIDSDGSTAGYVRWFVNHSTNLRRSFSRRQVFLLLLLLLFLSNIHLASHGQGLVETDQAPPPTRFLFKSPATLSSLFSHDFFRAFPREYDAQNRPQGLYL